MEQLATPASIFLTAEKLDPRNIREEVTGKVLTLAPALAPLTSTFWRSSTCRWKRRPGTSSILPGGASRRSTRSSTATPDATRPTTASSGSIRRRLRARTSCSKPSLAPTSPSTEKGNRHERSTDVDRGIVVDLGAARRGSGERAADHRHPRLAERHDDDPGGSDSRAAAEVRRHDRAGRDAVQAVLAGAHHAAQGRAERP